MLRLLFDVHSAKDLPAFMEAVKKEFDAKTDNPIDGILAVDIDSMYQHQVINRALVYNAVFLQGYANT